MLLGSSSRVLSIAADEISSKVKFLARYPSPFPRNSSPFEWQV